MTEPTDQAPADQGPSQPGSETGSEPGWLPELREQGERSRPGGDPDLVALVQVANGYGIEQTLVLTLAGQVLTGTLVSGRSHFETLAAAVQGQDPDDTLRGVLGASYRRRSAEYADWGAAATLGDLDPDGPADDTLATMPQAAFVHLRDVTVATAGGEATLPSWRGRIADVVGWTVLAGAAPADPPPTD